MNQINLDTALLRAVELPGRYVGGEFNQTKKSWQDLAADGKRLLRFAFCFPDTYEIGMSNLALRILYDVVNREEGLLCERVFAPWLDMKATMEEKDIPLFSLENHYAAKDFDCVGFTLSYELAFSPTLALMKLAGIPLRTSERGDGDPIIIAGGPATYNIEPMADFLDLVLIGEGEESLPELLKLMRQMRVLGQAPREEFLIEASKLKGVYVPSLYDISYKDDGTIEAIRPKHGAVFPVKKRVIMDLDLVAYPIKTPVPNIRTVHDRAFLEVFRGCPRGCRFCQAGQIYRPVREKGANVLAGQMEAILEETGYDEVGMLSLSTSDYSQLQNLMDRVLPRASDRKVNVSLPSLRIDNFSLNLLEEISKTRKAGLTFAPEAGSQRLRDVINKGIDEDEILRGMGLAFRGGYRGAKLYFMLGLPTETDEDVLAISALCKKIMDVWAGLKAEGLKLKRPEITISTALFIPKPFTPFQWVGQSTMDELEHKVKVLRESLPGKSIRYNWHTPETSRWEAVLARGDRRLGRVLERALLEHDVYLTSWEEFFDLSIFQKLMDEEGLSMAFYANRERSIDEIFPWDILDPGPTKAFLRREYDKAKAGELTDPCGEFCSYCGVHSWDAPLCVRGKEARRAR